MLASKMASLHNVATMVLDKKRGRIEVAQGGWGGGDWATDGRLGWMTGGQRNKQRDRRKEEEKDGS